MMKADNFLITSNNRNKTSLDNAYNKHINKIITTFNDDLEERWEMYLLVLRELNSSNGLDYHTEFKYRVTDGENPNTIILSIINNEIIEVNGLIWLLKRRIEEYLDEDYYNKFYQ